MRDPVVLGVLLLTLCISGSGNAADQLEVMREINAETCEPYAGTPVLTPPYQITNRVQLPTTSKFIDKLNILDLLDESQHADYLSTRSGAPLIQSRIQGLLATKPQSSEHFAHYTIQGKVAPDFQISNSLAAKTRSAMESPESASGEFKLVIYDSEGLKIETRRYEPYQIVMVGDLDSLQPRLATVNLRTDCENQAKFVTSVDGRFFEYAKQQMDFRLMFFVEALAVRVELTLHDIPLLDIDLRDID